MSEKKIAVILVRGVIGSSTEVKDTLKMLGLFRKNSCVLLPNTPSFVGMIDKVKDYITWGEVDKDIQDLLTKRKVKDKKFFRLSPPIKGFGRKGIKIPFSKGGALGNRKDKMGELISRMV